ncbi:alkaline phosphatase family protein [Roseovarius aquimarinus]|uniref:Alkaline phosphatase family protein n=1 Tax=Roseovarius aquimarinus TaxID=1229156 RepID=A0ABW7I4A0_9RHOB
MPKVILVIMDGTGYDAAVTQCGYLEGAVELGRARRWKMQTATPSLSGPMYETMHTGLWPHEHGITSNESMRASERPNVFSLSRAAGKVTAAVAQEYYHRLYVDRPWDRLRSIEHHDTDTDIQHARFYSMEGYGAINAVAPAEIDLCAQVTLLAERHAPDYLLLHSCSADTLGHTYGGDSAQYRYQVWMIDNALSRAIPTWLELGYEVMVTADHGMNAERHHGGMEPIMREVPFYYFGAASGPDAGELLSQLGLAATILNRLGVAPASEMRPAFL